MHDIDSINSELDAVQVAKPIICDIEDVKNHIIDYKKSLNILSQNIRSVNHNMPNFLTLLQRSEVFWDVLVLSECWLSKTSAVPILENYSHAATSAHKTQNEGVVVYFNKRLQVTSEEPPLNDANCIMLKINDTCIICIYRPPGCLNTTNFLNSLDDLLATLNNYKNIILCGDINIDIIPSSPDKRSYDYLILLASHSMLPGHTIPTHGRTCLDHMVLRTKLPAICLVIESSITDHESVAVSIELSVRLTYKKSVNHQIDYDGLDFAMKNTDLSPIMDCTDANLATDLLVSYISVSIIANTKKVKIPSRKRTNKPWITRALLRCMRNRDRLYKKLKKDPDNSILKVTYKRYRNFCNSLIKKAKKKHERAEIERAKSDKKKLWRVIKKISGTNKTSDYSTSLINPGNPQESVNDINSFFINVGKKLADRIPKQFNTQKNTASQPSPVKSFTMLPTDEEEVYRITKSLKDNCAVGADQISTVILKRYITILTPPITYICNLSMSTGVFPSAFKIALVKPIHKGGKRDCVNNFRPISILPAMSKILERIMNKRLVDYLETNALLSTSQYGFRRGRSTSDAVHDLVHSIVTNLDAKRKCLTLFLDLAKAFDTVSIPHLLAKLEGIGVRGTPLLLFQDYLTTRKQRVRVDHWESEELSPEFGIPQGSITGPTLFLVYINNLCQLQLRGCQILTFADDTALFFSGNTWSEVFDVAQEGFNTVSDWLRRNVLTLNVTKTKYIAFAFKSNLLPPSLLSITAHNCNNIQNCSCPALQRTDCIKYLGITIDQTLTYRPHVEEMVARLRKIIYVFKSLRHVADIQVIKTVYFALCQSLVDYCITSWGGAVKSHLILIERAQRAILKVGAGLPYRYPTADLYTKWEVLTVRQSFILHTVLKKHSQLPYDPELRKDKRRKGTVCPTQLYHTSLSHNFFCYQGHNLYNKLNSKLNIYSLNYFKCKQIITSYLLSLNYNDTEKLLTTIK